MPMTSETMTVREAMTIPDVGMSAPTALNRALMPLAMPMPAPKPSSEAVRPSRSASPSTLSSTWRRIAPKERSMANSRSRCATVMEKALKMMKAPTIRATPPKASSAGLSTAPRASLTALAPSAALCFPVFTSA
jgi:hypothetical protein